jgi:SAM-dependent methyltransferase
MLALIGKYQNGLILDCGAGRRDAYYENVVNFEIVPYDSTDILGVGEHIPFQSNSFEAVFSVAVLEHVRDPFRCASEIARVLKRGGELYCAIPFLQPLHGFPHHYFNATPQGARRLFEDMLRIDGVSAFHPIWALTWITRSWSEGLAEPTRSAFLDMPLKELLRPSLELLQHPFASELASEKQFELAAGTIIKATKELTGPEIGEEQGARAWQQRLRDWLWRMSRRR